MDSALSKVREAFVNFLVMQAQRDRDSGNKSAIEVRSQEGSDVETVIVCTPEAMLEIIGHKA